jgi:predicted dehydrogenase
VSKLRAAILGYGRSGGQLHAEALEATKDLFDMVAACDLKSDRLEAAHARFGCKTYKNYHQMIALEKPDLVIIVTRSHQHARMACDCLKDGANVLVTKPWCVNAGQARKMIDAQAATGKTLLPWLPARWGSDTRRVREIVDSGAIGQVIISRRVTNTFSIRADWQTDKKSGGGYLLNWGPHLVDTAVLAHGKGRKVVSAYAHMRHVMNTGDAEDVFMAAMTLDNGALAIAEYTCSPKPLPYWFVQGTNGLISMTEEGTLNITTRVGALPEPNPKNYGTPIPHETATEKLPPENSGDIYRDIAAALKGEKPYPVKLQDAYELTCLLDAIRKSDKTNRVVPIK